MTKQIKIKKGLDIALAGKAEGDAGRVVVGRVGICPDDYIGYTWKCDVKAGDSVKIGTPLFHAKEDEGIRLVSPVSGIINEIRRGERRKILWVSIDSNEEDTSEEFTENDIIIKLKHSGLWAMMRQRPYDIVPESDKRPRDIFVTGFDTAPLAPEVMPRHLANYLEAGLKVLSGLTDGKVYLSVRPGETPNVKSAEIIEVTGPHPAGNPGTQIAAIRPVNKGETVWTLDAGTAARIGYLAAEGKCDGMTEVAITGPATRHPEMVLTTIGADLKQLLRNNEPESHTRVISGNVLTGIKVDAENDFLRYPYRQITLLPEGDDADEFMGWASLNPKKYSVKRTFPAFMTGLNKVFPFDARIKGGHRAMILSGEMDKVFPFDIYPEYLIKAMIAGDYDRMEKLGIYEVAPEDFALPEFVDTSKQELQKLVRESLEKLRKDS